MCHSASLMLVVGQTDEDKPLNHKVIVSYINQSQELSVNYVKLPQPTKPPTAYAVMGQWTSKHCPSFLERQMTPENT